jgi:L-aminopeptidase/D-esterase-like protein
MITGVPDVRVGHWTGERTGVTVLLLPPGTIGAAEVRGGAPATREIALLEPGRTVQHVDAVVFSGGSAFGLAAADGVMRALADRGRGFPTRGGPVPIVPAAAIFDLVSVEGARPGPDEGVAALDDAAGDQPVTTGRVGAGRGATVGKWHGPDHLADGGLGFAAARVGDADVVALAVVNAVGDIVADDGTVLAGSDAPPGAVPFPDLAAFEAVPGDHGSAGRGAGGRGTGGPVAAEDGNTTLVAVVTDARCSKADCHLLAQSGHHGLARAIHPSHTRHDGDLVVALATGRVDAHLDRLRVVVTEVVAAAIRNAVAGSG